MTRLDVDAVLADRQTRIVLVCGAGGVGKTTLSAALGIRAAEAGRRTIVLTIDPARRLATALGIDELGQDPQRVPGVDESAGGHLDAMMLDMKRTFDDAIRAHASPVKAAQLLGNPFYQALSTSFSGTQEYMAMEKLGELARAGRDRWDLIVVDTPPSASALDFLDAPERLTALLEGRVLHALLAPARGPLRIIGAGMSAVTAGLTAIVGSQALADLQTFMTAFDSVTGGFRERAAQTRRTLSAPTTSCIIVTTPERAPIREARLLATRLHRDAIRLRGVVVNRVQPSTPDLRADASRAGVAAWAQRLGAMEAARRRREQATVAEGLAALAQVQVPAFSAEVTELGALRELGVDLAGGGD